MKAQKKHLLMTVMLTAIIIQPRINGAIGCIDTSFHTKKVAKNYYEQLEPSLRSGVTVLENLDAYPTDFKEPHPVWCTCPCEQYKKTSKSGRCTKCLHFGRIDRTSLQNNKEESSLHFPLLSAIVKRREIQQKH
ncbi:hypothetical protein JW872_03955 [Candidatus Babeliales bacterium]|nr:hypothetical protein [Candidatus Babeliales bacterium]